MHIDRLILIVTITENNMITPYDHVRRVKLVLCDRVKSDIGSSASLS